jgi:hypothetical protein
MGEADTWRGSVPPRVREGTEGPERHWRGESKGERGREGSLRPPKEVSERDHTEESEQQQRGETGEGAPHSAEREDELGGRREGRDTTREREREREGERN